MYVYVHAHPFLLANLLNEKQMADAIITYNVMTEQCAILTIIYFR